MQIGILFAHIAIKICRGLRIFLNRELYREYGYSSILANAKFSLLFFFLMSAYIPEGYSWSDNIIQSVNWIISCFSAIWNGCWLYVINPLLSWVTGLDSRCI